MWELIERLLHTSVLNDNEKNIILERWKHIAYSDNEFAEAERNEIIQNLYNNQIDPITHGYAYGQNDIKRHLKKLR